MLEQLIELVNGGRAQVAEYAWQLFRGRSDGNICLKELMELIDLLTEKQVECAASGEPDDPWNGTPYSVCAGFAFALVMKDLLDGRLRFENGALTDGVDTVPLGNVIDPAPERDPDFEDVDHIRSRRFRDILHFDPEHEAFVLAPLDHCVRENIIAILYLIDDLRDCKLFSLERLRARQRMWPERMTLTELKEAVARYCDSMLDFCEIADNSDFLEDERLSERVENAPTAAEAIIAETAREYFLALEMTFPYTAYLLLTGQLTEVPIREEPASAN